MNFFEQQLRLIKIDATPTFVGRDCYFNHNGLITKIYFDTTSTHEHYDCIRLETKSRDSIINKQTMLLKDLLGTVKDSRFPSPVVPHIWEYNGKYEWYAYKPTPENWETIGNAIRTYINVWHSI